ncbi:3-deoxy-7-phosphoheptulonate synthase [Candidatus Peregrinibacteria bacterium CG10_big_fil_rev_8_21_14_0_10_49_10]|nr:MAG: 3-deoxy-7-phosphoheptulonate synthase [Candidatus Peregrinibacteria bacterium CG10_big_fil_rev_8_21_14_0_10_49_10]
MAFTVERDLPPIQEVLQTYPAMPEVVEQQRESIRRILEGKDQRLLVGAGPCSFFPIEAGVQNAKRIADFNKRFGDVFYFIERVYSIKPRTNNGWEGIQFNPYPNKPHNGGVNIVEGIYATRSAFHQVAPHIGVMDEILNPDLKDYFNDLLCCGAIGARNACAMWHRRAAGGMEFPMGMKHDMSGDLKSAVDGVIVAQTPGNHLILQMKQQSVSGNPHAFAILRGSEANGPNWEPHAIGNITDMLCDAQVKNPAVIVDCSHANCIDRKSGEKTVEEQMRVLRAVVKNRFDYPEAYRHFRGIMTEVFTLPGKQKAGPDMNMEGLSITDPCIGIDNAESLFEELADYVRQRG